MSHLKYKNRYEDEGDATIVSARLRPYEEKIADIEKKPQSNLEMDPPKKN